jgi:PKD repeat protein
MKRLLFMVALLSAAGTAFGSRVTLPVAASVQGLAVYKTDVRAFNRSHTASIDVTATYHYCAASGCGLSAEQSFSLSPRESLAMDDIVVETFGLPNTQGAVEFETDGDDLLVSGRLFSPPTGPSFGQFVPGLADSDAHPLSVLTSLKQTADFRTNVGAYNPSPTDSFVATFSVFDGDGTPLGSFTKHFAPNEFLPASPLFTAIGAAGVSTDNAYCVVDAGNHPLFTAASILDNHSQDTILVIGQEDEAGAPGSGAPVANFLFSPASPAAGASVSFTDASFGSPTSWSWNFGDPGSGSSNTSTQKNPSHTFAAPGSYSVSLVASNASGPSVAAEKSVAVQGGDSAPLAAFAFSPANPTAGQPVSFSDSSTGNPTSWSWNFGDPGSGSANASTQKNPSHTYAAGGSYSVQLVASNGAGSSLPVQKTVTVAAAASVPTANFSFSPSSPQAGLAVAFTDHSTGSPTSWSWNFGDPGSGSANTSTQKNPSHTFAAGGAYTVSLVASNAAGASAPHMAPLSVAGAPPNSVTVQVGDDFYNPKNVTIAPGMTVHWVLTGSLHNHTVTDSGGAFNSGMTLTSSGATFDHTFTAADAGKKFDYLCTSHGSCCGMVGSVTVSSTTALSTADETENAPAEAMTWPQGVMFSPVCDAAGL